MLNGISSDEDSRRGRWSSRRSLLKKETFRLARQMDPIPNGERSQFAPQCLEKGDIARGTRHTDSGTARVKLTALAQAKIAFVEFILELCARYDARAFASIVDC